jgi:hypothetical protein
MGLWSDESARRDWGLEVVQPWESAHSLLSLSFYGNLQVEWVAYLSWSCDEACEFSVAAIMWDILFFFPFSVQNFKI